MCANKSRLSDNLDQEPSYQTSEWSCLVCLACFTCQSCFTRNRRNEYDRHLERNIKNTYIIMSDQPSPSDRKKNGGVNNVNLDSEKSDDQFIEGFKDQLPPMVDPGLIAQIVDNAVTSKTINNVIETQFTTSNIYNSDQHHVDDIPHINLSVDVESDTFERESYLSDKTSVVVMKHESDMNDTATETITDDDVSNDDNDGIDLSDISSPNPAYQMICDNLTVIKTLKPYEKLNVSITGALSVDNSYIPSLSRTFTGNNKFITMERIKETIIIAKQLQNVVECIGSLIVDPALIDGLNALEVTYANDEYVKKELDDIKAML